MITVLASQIFIVVMLMACVIVLFSELINFLFGRNKTKFNFSLNFLKWCGMLFLIILTVFSTWDLINITETLPFISDIPFNDNSSRYLFWLLDFPFLIIGLIFSQLLWFKFFNSSIKGKIIWALLVLILVSITPFISELFMESTEWSTNEIQSYLERRDASIHQGQNQMGIVLTSSSKPYLPAVIMFVIVALLALIITRRMESKPSQSVS